MNPALAYQQGGASTPQGAQAHISDSIGAAKGSAQGAAQSYQAIQAQIATTQQTREQTKLTAAQTTQLNLESTERVRELQARAGMQETSADVARNMFPHDVGLKASQMHLQDTQSSLNKQNWKYNEHSFAQRLELLKREIDSNIAHAREMNSKSLMNEYQTPELRNRARTQDDWFKKKVSPYLSDARGAASLGADIYTRGRR